MLWNIFLRTTRPDFGRAFFQGQSWPKSWMFKQYIFEDQDTIKSWFFWRPRDHWTYFLNNLSMFHRPTFFEFIKKKTKWTLIVDFWRILKGLLGILKNKLQDHQSYNRGIFWRKISKIFDVYSSSTIWCITRIF